MAIWFEQRASRAWWSNPADFAASEMLSVLFVVVVVVVVVAVIV